MAEHRRTRVDAWFDIEGEGVLETERSVFRPVSAHVSHVGGEMMTVWVRGPILKANGEQSKRNAVIIYGKYGGGFDHAPQWVRDLVKRVKRMELFDVVH